MQPEVNHREKIRLDLIQKVGPWAFQSYSKDRWINVSNCELISGALLRGIPEDRYLLLEVFDLEDIRKVWDRHVVIQDDWFHNSNIWAAKHIFNADDPEKIVKKQLKKSRKIHWSGAPGVDVINLKSA